jgi:uncharacterized protein (TIGR02466 family)
MSTRAEDVRRLRRAVRSDPSDRVSWHNLAAAQGDTGNLAEAEEAARRAITLGIPAPETRLVLARALQGLGQLDEAQAMFSEAIRLRPAYAEAHRDLAQLVWMRTADAKAALERLTPAQHEAPMDPGLHLIRAIVLEYAGDLPGAVAAAEAGLAQVANDRPLMLYASHLYLDAGNTQRAMALAQRASTLAPAGSTPEMMAMCEALLAAGRIEEADATAEELVRVLPNNQYALALQATTWRMRGDRRYGALCDYGSLVAAQKLDLPPGWASLDAFLADVARELEGLHSFRSHPLQQSIRGGSLLHIQAAELARPVIGALFGSISAAVKRYVTSLGPGKDPLRARNTGRFGFTGAWSVRLRSGGHHADHVHANGWISSACYIALPPGMGAREGDRAGWLRLGKPPVPTLPPIAADHFVKPEAGLLVLFPSYMWHGVEPFEADSPRLAVAFDVAPT